MWSQIYDPFNNVWLSTFAAAIPVVVMLAALAFFHIKAHIAALMGLIAALVVAIWGFTMPANAAVAAALYGAAHRLDYFECDLSVSTHRAQGSIHHPA